MFLPGPRGRIGYWGPPSSAWCCPRWCATVVRAVAVSLPHAHQQRHEMVTRCGELTVDVETTGYSLGHRHYQLRTVQLGDASTAIVFDATGPTHASTIRTLLAKAPRLYAHSATADVIPLAYAGLIGADFSGIELRVAAALSGDTNLQRMIRDGIDVHGAIARQVFGPHATKADRYAVKRGVFGRLYGGGIPTLAAQVGCSHTLAEAMVATLAAMTPTLIVWSAQLRNHVQAGQTQFTTYTGATVHTYPGAPRTRPRTT